MTDEAATKIANALLEVAVSIDRIAELLPVKAGALVLHCETFHNQDSALKIRIEK